MFIEKLNGKKVLYFEGAGMDFYSSEQTKYSDVGNFRIRTSFLNNDGEQYYIELGNGYRQDKKGKNNSEMCLRIDHLFKVKDRNHEELRYGGYEIKRDWEEIKKLNYTKQDITKWINENLNCSFDTIHVLDNFYGYYVHGKKIDGSFTYNLMEDIELNHKRAKARKETYNKADTEYRTRLNEKYSKISLLEMNDNNIIIRCYASENAIQQAGLERIKEIEVIY